MASPVWLHFECFATRLRHIYTLRVRRELRWLQSSGGAKRAVNLRSRALSPRSHNEATGVDDEIHKPIVRPTELSRDFLLQGKLRLIPRPTKPSPKPPGLGTVLERNIQALKERRTREEAEAGFQERLAQAITRFTGSMGSSICICRCSESGFLSTSA